MKFDINKIKTNAKTTIGKYRKQIGSSVVVASMVVVCATSLVDRAQEQNIPTGMMMSVSDVNGENVTETFAIAGISHEEMMEVNFQTEQLARLELSDKQVDEVLSSERPDRKDQATVDALTAANYVEEVEVPSVSTPVIQPVTYTYADANGTYEYIGDYELTAYCPCSICCGSYSNVENPRTASGVTPTAGHTIAAPSSMPFGTQLNINGVMFVVEDRGGAINGNRLDVFFNTHEEAVAFGRQTVPVYRLIQ